MLFQVGNPLAIIKLANLMEKYRISFFGVDKLTDGLYGMQANNMPLIPEKATIMPQVSNTDRICPPDTSQTFGSSIGT